MSTLLAHAEGRGTDITSHPKKCGKIAKIDIGNGHISDGGNFEKISSWIILFNFTILVDVLSRHSNFPFFLIKKKVQKDVILVTSWFQKHGICWLKKKYQK